jgi:hypothetical protein
MKPSKLFHVVSVVSFFALLAFASPVFAVPALQLGITDGVYVGGNDETTYATSPEFTLNAYLDPSKADKTDAYFLSMAVVPKMSYTTPPPDLGSFTFQYGTSSPVTVHVTQDMSWGVPPYEGLISAFDSGDLSKHGIFETYFYEKSFTFDLTQYISPKINTQDGTTSSGMLYLREFEINVTNLADGYQIHFDLYSEKLAKRSTTDLDINLFAPFSHDAQSNGHQVPEPGTLVLMGSGLLGLVVFRKKIQR